MKFNIGDQVFISGGYYEGIIAEITNKYSEHYEAKVLEDPNNNTNRSPILIDDFYLKPNIKNIPDPYESEDQLQEHKKQAEEYLNSPKDEVVGESPYNDYEVQPIEFVLENEDVLHPTDAFLLNNVLKYICRHRDKGGKEDLEKAIHYIKLVKEHTYDSN